MDAFDLCSFGGKTSNSMEIPDWALDAWVLVDIMDGLWSSRAVGVGAEKIDVGKHFCCGREDVGWFDGPLPRGTIEDTRVSVEVDDVGLVGNALELDFGSSPTLEHRCFWHSDFHGVATKSVNCTVIPEGDISWFGKFAATNEVLVAIVKQLSYDIKNLGRETYHLKKMGGRGESQ